MVNTTLTRIHRVALAVFTAVAGVLLFIALTPQAAFAKPSYAYCASCHSAGSGVTISVTKTGETASQAAYTVSGSAGNAGQGWAIFDASQAKIASGSSRPGSFSLPLNGAAYTAFWIDTSGMSGMAITSVIAPLPAPPAPPAPALSSVSPASGLNSGATVITIRGANFVATPAVRLGSTTLSASFVNATTMTATVPAGLAGGSYGITVTNPDGQAISMANAFTVTVPAPPAPPAPALSSVSPTTGLNSGSTMITIRGANFVATPTVKLGSTILTGVTFVNATTLNVNIPAGLAGGIYGISVVNPDGQTAALSNAFTVTVPIPAPVLTGISPTMGLNSGSVLITIRGANFMATPVVRLGSTVLTSVSFVNATTVTAVVPAGMASGVYGLTVINPDGQTAALSNAFTVTVPAPPAPVVSSVSPAAGLNDAPVIITIRGGNYTGTPIVRMGSITLTGVIRVDASTLTAIVPAGMTGGVYGITVVNPDSQSATMANAYTVTIPAPPAPAAPTLSGATPTSGLNSGAIVITIRGANFVATPTVKLGSTILTASFVNATTLTATVPAGFVGGVYGITVTNPDGQSAAMASAYTVTIPAPPVPAAPILSSVSPTSGLNNAVVMITIRGANFVATPSIKLGSTVLTGVTFVNASTLTVNIPAGLPAGVYGITVTNPDGQIAALSNVFTITLPAPTTPPVVTPPAGDGDDDDDRDDRDKKYDRRDDRRDDRDNRNRRDRNRRDRDRD